MGEGTGIFLLRKMQNRTIFSITAAKVSTKNETNSDIQISAMVSEVNPAESCPITSPGDGLENTVAVVVKVETETCVMVVTDTVVAMDTGTYGNGNHSKANRCTCTLYLKNYTHYI